MKSSSILLFCVITLVLSIVIFFGGYLANPHHPLDILYGSLISLGACLLFGGLYFFVRRTE